MLENGRSELQAGHAFIAALPHLMTPWKPMQSPSKLGLSAMESQQVFGGSIGSGARVDVGVVRVLLKHLSINWSG